MAVIQTEELSSREIFPFERLTFPRLRALVGLDETEHFRTLRIGARMGGRPVGLLLGQRLHDRPILHVLSLFTVPSARRQGVATCLAEACEGWARQHGVRRLVAEFTAASPARPALDRLLEGRGCPPAEKQTSLVTIGRSPDRYQRFLQTPVGAVGCRLPQGYAFVPWLEVAPADLEALQVRVQGTLPPGLSPFDFDATPVDPSSTALVRDGEIIGWMINHRVAPDMVAFARLYVMDHERRGSRLGIKLVNEACRRVSLPPTEDSPTVIFRSREDNTLMKRYIQAMGSVVTRTDDLLVAQKEL